MQSEKPGLLMLLLAAYIIAAGFTDVLSLPVVGKKIQIAELIFIPIFISWIFFFRKDIFTRIKPDKLQWSIMFYLIVVMLSAVSANQFKGYLEVAGLVYLVLVFIIFKTTLSVIPNPATWMTKSFMICGLAAASLGVIGWLLFQFGVNNTFVIFNPEYPYFGQVARATGMTTTPNMLFNLVGICFLICFSSFLFIAQKKPQHYLVLSILALALILTFSKSLLLLLICILVLCYQHSVKNKRSKYALIGFSVLMFVICMIGTHFIFIHPKAEHKKNIYEGYFENKPIASIGDYQVFPSVYSVLKEKSIIAGTENIFGVGPGGNNTFLQKLKLEGKYPEYFENFDPHSIYTGTFGELGIFGLAALLWMMYNITRQIFHTLKSSNIIGNALAVCFLFLAMEGIMLDILNFRHLWILLGLLAYTSANPRSVFDATIPVSPNNRRTPG